MEKKFFEHEIPHNTLKYLKMRRYEIVIPLYKNVRMSKKDSILVFKKFLALTFICFTQYLTISDSISDFQVFRSLFPRHFFYRPEVFKGQVGQLFLVEKCSKFSWDKSISKNFEYKDRNEIAGVKKRCIVYSLTDS